MSGVEACLDQAMGVPGAVGASIVDYRTGTCLGRAGTAPDDDPGVAAGVTAVLDALTRRAPFTSADPADALEDIIITSRSGYHLIRRLPADHAGSVVLYLWLDRDRGNLAVGRRSLCALGHDLVPA